MRRSKYNAVPTVVDGIRFDSKKEAARYQDLKLLQRAKQINNLAAEKESALLHFPIVLNGVKVCTYKADFRYDDEHGNDVVEDVKGVKTAAYRMKKKLVKAVYGIEIREV